MMKIYKKLAGMSLVSVFALGAAVGCEEQGPTPDPGEAPPANEPMDDPANPVPQDGANSGDENGSGNGQDSYELPAPPSGE